MVGVRRSRRARGARATSDGHNIATTTSATSHQQPYYAPRRGSTMAVVSELQKQVGLRMVAYWVFW